MIGFLLSSILNVVRWKEALCLSRIIGVIISGVNLVTNCAIFSRILLGVNKFSGSSTRVALRMHSSMGRLL